jgi:hypothetical protein
VILAEDHYPVKFSTRRLTTGLTSAPIGQQKLSISYSVAFVKFREATHHIQKPAPLPASSASPLLTSMVASMVASMIRSFCVETRPQRRRGF